MVAIALQITVTEFEQIAALPENADRRLELIAGEVVEVVSSQYCSQVAGRLIVRLGAYVEQHDLGYYSVPDGGYAIGDNRVMPDVAFVSKARQPAPSQETWASVAPDLAVEVISSSDSVRDVASKITIYLAAGVTVWLIDPADKTLTVYRPGQLPRTLGAEDTVEGGEVLPGFALKVGEVFPA